MSTWVQFHARLTAYLLSSVERVPGARTKRVLELHLAAVDETLKADLG